MPWPIKQRPQSVLGLGLSDDRLHAVEVQRRKGVLLAGRPVSTALTIPWDSPDAERLGETVQGFLKSAGLRERACVVTVPASWIMSQTVPLPAGISPADQESFLEIEAEKGFPCNPDELQLSRSYYRSGTSRFVTQFAVRREQLAKLAATLAAADLNPVSITTGLIGPTGGQTPARPGRITVIIEAKGSVVAITAGGGLVSYRSCAAGPGDGLGRELRITVEQVPSELRSEIRELVLTGEESLIKEFKGTIATWAASMGLELTCLGSPGTEVADKMTGAAASHWLETAGSQLEFLPPRPSRWSLWLARYNFKRAGGAVAVAAGALVLLLGMFGWQEYRRVTLRARWQAMSAQVTVLQTVQTNIRDFRPWYDPTLRDLRVLRTVAESFPDNGSVTAKSVEIRGPVTVSISGTAQDNDGLLRTLGLLRKAKEIKSLKVEQIHGKTPLQFTVNFRWEDNTAP